MGAHSRRKGNRIENEILRRLQEAGVDAVDVPLSGQCGGEFRDDTLIRLADGTELRGEVKARKNGTGFRTVINWLGQSDVLVLRQDRTEPIVALSWATFITLIKRVPSPGPSSPATTPPTAIDPASLAPATPGT